MKILSPLTKEQQISCNLARGGGVPWDESQVDWKMIAERVAFNANIAAKYNGVNVTDMEFAAWEGVAKAVTNFKPEFGASFENYAITYMKSYMRRAQYEFKSIVRIPCNSRHKGRLSAAKNCEVDPNDGRLFTTISERAAAEQEEERQVLLNHVAAALEDFDPKGKKVLELYYFGGLSCAKIGSKLGVSGQQAHNILKKARTTLAKRVNESLLPDISQ